MAKKTEQDDFQKAFGAAAAATEEEDAKGEGKTPAGKPKDAKETKAGEVQEADATEDKDAKDGESDSGEDYKTLYEREKQRLKSLEGRYRKERDAWTDERRELLNRVGDVAAASAAGESAAPSAGEAAPAVDPSVAQSLRSMIQREARALIEPVLARVEQDRHVQAIAAAHPDWEEVARDEQLEAWIDEHPDYVAASMRDVISTGAADQVVDLITRFKQARTRKPAQGRPEAGRPVQPTAEQAMRARQATAVPSRSAGPPPAKPDPNDYMSAWQEALGQ